ncbi:MBL fold metallo-hydrolase [Streptomyces sp. NRRL S-241]|uniref:MBL fold metallo-hydrolase n=1 Tax=Streptomyces sp. NRRL S-241 TaxID=1463896 RepID=UPI0004C1C1A2|nr:MBL fold metallo-hydrolase [Streptomyces sp. NRRL S-241]
MSPSRTAQRLNRPSPIRTHTIGEYRLTHVPDGLVQLRPTGWFPGLTAADTDGFADHLDADGCLVAAIGGLLVEYGDRALLIDTGYGPRRLAAGQTHPALGELGGGGLLGSLADVGREPAGIDTIAFTHLHDDHVGWAFLGTDRGPLFSSASFVLSAAEWQGGGAGQIPAALHDRVRPAVDGEEVFPGISLRETPGHTGGHASYVLTADGGEGIERLIIAGDVLHSPLQVAHPQWPVFFDSDAATAVRTRTAFVQDAATPGTVVYAGHFADVVFGRVRADQDGGHVWDPLTDLT